MFGAKKEDQGPALQGIRVIDLTQMLAGPFGSMLMGDLGAEIIKVESLQEDETRSAPPYFYGEDSAYFWSINRNKKSVAIDLKSPEGLEVFYELVEHSDVVYDNFRPGILERLKIDYESLNIAIQRLSVALFPPLGTPALTATGRAMTSLSRQ